MSTEVYSRTSGTLKEKMTYKLSILTLQDYPDDFLNMV